MQYLPSILAAIGIMCNLFLGLYVFVSNRQSAKDAELQDAKSRIVTLEERVKNMPDHEDVSQMRSDISGLQSEVEGMGKILERVETNVNRLTDYLLNNRG